MIVIAHGLDGDPDALAATRRHLGARGLRGRRTDVPDHGQGRRRELGRRSETTLQAGDLRFVIDRMLAGNRDPTSPWSGGSTRTTSAPRGCHSADWPSTPSPRSRVAPIAVIDAAVLMASVYRDVPDSEQHPNRIPMMLLQGDVDPGYHNSQEAYSDLVAPKWFVTLHGSRHAPPFEAPRGPEAAVVDPATIGFWDGRLRHDPTGPARIAAAVRGQPRHHLAPGRPRAPVVGRVIRRRRAVTAGGTTCGKMAGWPSTRAPLDPRPRDRRARRDATRGAGRERGGRAARRSARLPAGLVRGAPQHGGDRVVGHERAHRPRGRAHRARSDSARAASCCRTTRRS